VEIAYVISSLEGGGAALPVPAITRVLRDAGAQVRVFALTRRNGRALPAMLADGLDVLVRDGGQRDHFAAVRWLDRALAQYQPSHVWTSLTRATVIGLLVAWRRKIPIVCWQHNAYLEAGNLRVLWALRHRPVAWVGDSDMVSALTAERFNVPPERLFTWSLFAADAQAPQAQPWRPGKTLRLGSLGRLHPQKGYDVLMTALALLSQRGFRPPTPIEITIAGDGAEREAIAGAARQAGFCAVHLPGFIDQPRDFLASLHLYLQPSRAEGLCIALHEAMQAGLPVIASTVGQMPFTVEPGRSGWLVPPVNPLALADALAAALSEPAPLARIGQAARAQVLTRFSAAAFRQAGETVLAKLAADARAIHQPA